MAYRLVYTDFWNSPKVLEEMTPEDKLFYLYLLTNPNTNMIGIYKITKKQMAFELGYSSESINSLMDRFENHHKLIKYNSKTREIVIIKWGKYNLNKGGKPVIDCIKKDLSQVEDINFIEAMIHDIKGPVIRQLFQDKFENHESSTNRHTIGGQYQYLIPNTNTNTNISSSEEIEEDILVKLKARIKEKGYSLQSKEILSLINLYGITKTFKAIEASLSVKSEIKNFYGYVTSVLADMEKQKVVNINAEKKNIPGGFNNFEQREYDFDSLERKLLGWDKE